MCTEEPGDDDPLRENLTNEATRSITVTDITDPSIGSLCDL